MSLSEIITAIESELNYEYMPGAINWCDKNHDYAWSNAIDRFDRSLTIAQERMDHALLKAEADHYKSTILDLIKKYKHHKKMDDTELFLKSISIK